MKEVFKRLGLLLVISALVNVSVLKPCRADDEKIDNNVMKDLVNRMSHQPELMHLAYVQCYIGAPTDSPANRVAHSKHYVWCRPGSQGVKYELLQEESAPGVITESTFVMHTDDIKMDLTDIESKLGSNGHKFFDQKSSPTEEYSFAPDTQISFTQKQNKFQITRIAVHYKGPQLPAVSDADIAMAQGFRKMQAMNTVQNGTALQSITKLKEHIAEHPEDMEAQLALAQSYKANCQLNESISQYQRLMSVAQASGDQDTVNACTQGLQQLRVLPVNPSDNQIQQHQVQLLQKGQRMRVGDLNKNSNDPAMQANGMGGNGNGFNGGGMNGGAMNGGQPTVRGGVGGSPDNPFNIQPLDPPGGQPQPLSNGTAPDFRRPWSMPAGGAIAPGASSVGAPLGGAPTSQPGDPF